MKNSCIYGSKRITRTGDNAGKTELLPLRAPERIIRRVSAITIEVRFAEMIGNHHYNERVHTLCKSSILLFGQFYKNKVRLQKHRQLIWCFLSLFCMYSVISAFVINIAVY